jgi:hypothetical protein
VRKRTVEGVVAFEEAKRENADGYFYGPGIWFEEKRVMPLHVDA